MAPAYGAAGSLGGSAGPDNPEGRCADGGHEAADGRRSAGGHQGRTRHRDARPARGRWPPRCRAERRGGRQPRGRPQGRRRLSAGTGLVAAYDIPSLPAQVSPPEFALSAMPPHAILGAEVVALPVLPGEAGGLVLGPDAEALGDALGVDLFTLLEMSEATGKAGEVVTLPVPMGSPDNSALRWLLLVGIGEQRLVDFRRARAAPARAAPDRGSGRA